MERIMTSWVQVLGVWIASGAGVPSLDSKFLTLSDPCSLYAVVQIASGEGRRAYVAGVARVSGLGEAVSWDPSWGEIQIRWYRVEHAQEAYRNGSHNPRWWAPVRYVETFFDTGWVVPCDVRPTVLRGAGGANVGTMHFRLEVIYRGDTLRTPGREAADVRGVLRGVHRISRARDTSLVGLAFAWFNLPYIWGSASLRDQDPPEEHQTERFVGADCADLMVAVLRRWTGLPLRYRNSAAFREGGALDRYLRTLFRDLRPDTSGVFRDGRGRPVPVGPRGVRPGDFLVYRRHVALFSRDTPPEGVLDLSDLHIHTCKGEVTEDAIQEGFPPPLDVRRWVGPPVSPVPGGNTGR